MLHLHFVAGLALAFAPHSSALQDPTPVPAAVTPAAEAVQVPAFPNTTCPIMGKPISTRLFTDTKFGRIYICCKACVKDIQADVEHAYKTAYPTTEKLENKVCPVTAKAITKDAVRVELQGRDFLVADKDAAVTALANAQATLAKLADPKLQEVANGKCPITGRDSNPNTIAIIEGHIVRFANDKAIEEARKQPFETLAKAVKIKSDEVVRAAEEVIRQGKKLEKQD